MAARKARWQGRTLKKQEESWGFSWARRPMPQSIKKLRAGNIRVTLSRYNLGMKSHEIIRNAVEELGVKAVAAGLKVSAALVYKWCEPPAEQDDPDGSGTKNPLDRVREMYLLTKDIRLIRWLCNEAGGFFAAN